MIDATRREAIGAIAAGAAAASLAPGQLLAAVAPPRPELWYGQPANSWTEALPIGNGRLSAMVFGGVAKERLQLNEGTLWAGGPYDPVNPKAREALPRVRELVFAGRIEEAQALADTALIGTPRTQMPYQVLGDLTLEFPGLVAQPESYRRALDLDSATASTRFTIDGVEHRREVIAAPGDQVIAMRLTAAGGRGVSVEIGLSSPQAEAAVGADGGDTLLMTGRNGGSAGVDGALTFAARVQVRTDGGRIEQLPGGRLAVRDANSVTLIIAMATSYRRFDDVSGDPIALTAATIASARRRSFATIAADASAAHQALFRRVAIDLGSSAAAALPTDERIRRSQTNDDPALAALYFNYARYLLISCSRPGGQPATLQGLWNDSLSPPWGSKYTVNINTEMNYWPAQAANLSECVEPLVRAVRELAETGARTAREMYGARGWVCHHNTDLWRATAPIDGAKWGMWPTGGAWLCTHLWEHYDYTRDLAFLRSVYPVMAGAARFFLDTLQTDPSSGALVTNPSISPENEHGHGGALCAGPTMDIAILRDLFDQTIAAAGLLGTDAAMVAEMRSARERLAPYKVGQHGQLQEWQADWDADAPEQDHRHISHLYGLYPSNQISLRKTPGLAGAARRSLEIRGDQATGWATAWRINCWARLGDGERAHDILGFLLGPERTYPNMFDAHPPFQIDGNFGGAAGIIEMLVQSDHDVIELLPALPSAWPRGSIRGLRLRGACGLNIRWADGRLADAVLHPDRDDTRVVRLGKKARRIALRAGRARRLTPRDFS